MKRFSWLISKYLAQAVIPYFVLSWLLLSVLLFVQQGSRYSEIFFNVNIPKNLIWQLTLALIPNVIAFTCPMAVLVGVIIGLSKMKGDSELVAIRTAGVGNFQIAVPFVVLGIVLSLTTFIINLDGVPFAAKVVRKVALQTALYKLESPIEPGVFNTEIGGYTIYVKNGDIEKGTWKNIFIYYEEPQNKRIRLITSTEGRIDYNDETSELVLENALINTISGEKSHEELISEKVSQLRLTIKTKRAEAIEKITTSEQTPEELGLSELSSFANTKTGKQKIEAEILWQRRIILSITPLIFAILGVALVLRFNRGGRGFGIILALGSLVIHYLLTLIGEQLSRTSQISVLTGGLLPVLTSVLLIFWFFFSKPFLPKFSLNRKTELKTKNSNLPFKAAKITGEKFYGGITTGILDFDIVWNLLKYFLLTFVFLTTVYLIFTAFELWKFAGEISGGSWLLAEYLFYLLPFVYIQLAPSALMIATLATFVIKSRQNEIVTWTAAGQSIYRLLLPCFLLMIFIGIFNWEFQERILPSTNQKQDALRSQIRNRGVLAEKNGKFWMADDKRIFSFEFNGKSADSIQKVKNLSIYEFSDDGANLQTIFKTPLAEWEKDTIRLLDNAEKTVWTNGKVEVSAVPNLEIVQSLNPFNEYYQKPGHLDAEETRQLIDDSESETERRNYEVALQKKYATPFLPFIITLFTAPFALSLSRKGKAVTIGYAVGIWLLFIGFTGVFEQFGMNDFLSPAISVWNPIILFTILGVYLLAKAKT